mmetsp:Transcript_73406/g.215235  ORF Transcript_73406/g.215235 Transcript_73406/m.215235 type:complete len:325 (+) Transcript_73406:87-1061(+)
MSISTHTGAVELFSGPHLAGVDHANWDSVSLELRGDGHFSLELWHFYESWDYIPEDVEDAGDMIDRPVPNEDDAATGVNGVPLQRANHPREVEEVRVTMRGHFTANKALAVRLRGFRRQELNQCYTEDSRQLIGGTPTWWSEDGLHFFYFDVARGHWRANSVRLIGGAGVRGVAPLGRRAGSGIAHSASVKEGEDPVAALTCSDGWFEVDSDGSWHPQTVDVLADHARVLDFHASDIVFEERHARGAEGAVEEKHAAGPVAFRGWHQRGSVRLVMPPLPDRIQVAADEAPPVEVVEVGSAPQSGSNFLGDPDSLILRPHVTSRL